MLDISTPGFFFVLIITGGVLVAYAFRNSRNLYRDYAKNLFFVIWICLFGKTVRSTLLAPVGNVIIVMCIALLLVHAFKRPKVRVTNNFLLYLFSCFFLYSGITFIWMEDGGNILLWAVSFMTFLMLMRLVTTYEIPQLIQLVFGSFQYCAIYMILVMVGFTVVFPDQSIWANLQVSGPFGPNYCARNLLTIVCGLLLLSEKTMGQHIKIVLWVLLVLIVCTLSRSGILIMLVFCLPNYRKFITMHYAIILIIPVLFFIEIGLVFYKPDITALRLWDNLETRFVGNADSGRIGLMESMLMETQKDIWFGRGFHRASVDTFVESTDPTRLEGFSSHCYYLSVLYEYGIVGCAIIVSLLLSISWTHAKWAWHERYGRYFFWIMISYCISALLENSNFLPAMPYGFLVLFSLVVGTCSESVSRMNNGNVQWVPVKHIGQSLSKPYDMGIKRW